jgi:hypothetical protein
MELVEWSMSCWRCGQTTTVYTEYAVALVISAHKDCISREDNERRLNEWRMKNGFAYAVKDLRS